MLRKQTVKLSIHFTLSQLMLPQENITLLYEVTPANQVFTKQSHITFSRVKFRLRHV